MRTAPSRSTAPAPNVAAETAAALLGPFRIGLLDVTVDCRDPTLARSIDAHGAQLRADGAPDAPRVRRRFAVARRGDLWEWSDLDAGVVRPIALPDDPAPLAEVFAELNVAVVEAHPRWSVFHAGAVAAGRGAHVTFGLSGSGKSTLTGALVRLGADYLSDEVALIEPAARVVHPYAKPLSLSVDSLGMIGVGADSESAGHAAVGVGRLGGHAAADPVELAAFWHVDHRRAGPPGQMRPAEAVMAMLPNYMCFAPERDPLAELVVLVTTHPVLRVPHGLPLDAARSLLAIDPRERVDLEPAPSPLPPVAAAEVVERAIEHLGPFSQPSRVPRLVGARFRDGAVVLDRGTGEHVAVSTAGFDVIASLDGTAALRTVARTHRIETATCVEFVRGLAARGWLQGYTRTEALPVHPHAAARR